MTIPDRHFTLEQLAVLVGLPRRTVRFYLQQGLLERPVGLGRGAYYTGQHLEQLLTVKKWKDAGLSLERIRELVGGEPPAVPPRPVRVGQVEVWSRVQLADGLELQVQPGRAGISPEQLRRLVAAITHAYEHVRQEEERQ
jgi:DNA-binding transcriptional MerR regulator